jgi:hypothetical protein
MKRIVMVVSILCMLAGGVLAAEKEYVITASLRQELINYLIERPLKETYQIFNKLAATQELKKIKEETVEEETK